MTSLLVYILIGVITTIYTFVDTYIRGHNVTLGDAVMAIVFIPILWPIVWLGLLSENGFFEKIVIKGKKK